MSIKQLLALVCDRKGCQQSGEPFEIWNPDAVTFSVEDVIARAEQGGWIHTSKGTLCAECAKEFRQLYKSIEEST